MITSITITAEISNREVDADQEFGPISVDTETIVLRGRKLRNFLQYVVGPRNREQAPTKAADLTVMFMEEPNRLIQRGSRDNFDRIVEEQVGDDYEDKLAATTGKARYTELFGVAFDEVVRD